MLTRSDKLDCVQRHEVDNRQEEVPENDRELVAKMHSHHRRVSRCCCHCLCLTRIGGSGSSALFCETSYN